VTFSISDVQNMPNSMADDDDPAMYDEDDTDVKSGGANRKGSVNRAGTSDEANYSDDNIASADQPEFDDETLTDDEPTEGTYASRITIVVERPGKGALAVEAVADAGEILIEDFFHFPTGQLADPKSAEKEWERRSLYSGPSFEILDEELKVLLEKYLSERGIDTTLALFVPDYIDYKEQKEYLNFLNSEYINLFMK
jgi:complement component 1 Q subcomponent-binding protein, mitochondrial